MNCTNSSKERKTLTVIILTVITMFAEIIYGYITNSMALLADGYHMVTHALALLLTYVAYILIKKFEKSDLFKNGTNKIGTLAAYTSSLFLGLTGIWIVIEAVQRFFNPVQIQFNEAILIAFIGLVVNGCCVLIMENKAEHHHHKYHCCKEDYNFKAAYLHILADVLTSVLAIIALFVGKYYNFLYLDCLVGLFGGVMILRWALGLLKNTVKELVDMKECNI